MLKNHLIELGLSSWQSYSTKGLFTTVISRWLEFKVKVAEQPLM
jgi:hypothetical protein